MSSVNFEKSLIINYSYGGVTRNIANKIKERILGELFEITISDKYPQIPEFYDIAKSNLENKKFPKLSNPPPSLSSYDTIFVGSPVWWYTVSLPLITFLSKTDFQGKTVIPFATHGGGVGHFFVFKESQTFEERLMCFVEDLGSLSQKLLG
jgi:flavodoxin